MATNTTVDTSSTLLHDTYTESLSPLTSVVSLAEHLLSNDYISSDLIDRLILLEGEKGIGLVEAKRLLVDNLLSLGPAKVVSVKKLIREFIKYRHDLIEHLDVKVPPSLGGVVKGVANKDDLKEFETFSAIFYTFIRQFIISYEKSTTLRTRLLWLTCDTPISCLTKYFPSKDHTHSTSHVTVSMATLLEAFGHLKSSCKGENDVEKLLHEKESKINEILQVNEQWRLECSDLKEIITELQNKLSSKTEYTQEVENGEENEEEKEAKYLQALERISELERQLNSSVRGDDYQLLLQEKREISQQLSSLTEERDIFSSQLKQLQTENQKFKENNKSLLLKLESIKYDSEEQANHIDELKDQVSNLRLNLKSKEPSVREMSILLETNRKLTEEKTQLQTQLEELKINSSELLAKSERAMTESRGELEKENNKLKKALATSKDELLALRTYISDLEKQKTHDQSKGLVQKAQLMRSSATPPSRDVMSGRGFQSYSLQQRQCPVCSEIFREMNEEEFTTHVARCFQ